MPNDCIGERIYMRTAQQDVKALPLGQDVAKDQEILTHMSIKFGRKVAMNRREKYPCSKSEESTFAEYHR